MDLKEKITEVANFPSPGILFRDISPLLQSHEHLKYALEQMVAPFDLSGIDHIIGIESRGFILGAALAVKFKKGFVALRKAGKLPPPVHAQAYSLEYGQAVLEVKPGRGRVLIVDDVLATGGTLLAAIELCERAGYTVENLSVLINLKSLNRMLWKNQEVHSVLHY